MTNEELKAAIYVFSDGIDALRYLLNKAEDKPSTQVRSILNCFSIEDNKTTRLVKKLSELWSVREVIISAIQSARELLQLKEGTHPDMVLVPMEQWQPIETYDYKNFPEVWLAAWIEPSEYAKENGASAHWVIGMGRCWHVNTRKFTGVLGGSPTYWCKTNKPDLPAQKGNKK